MKYLICYDITSAKRLAKISKQLESKGYRVQLSFFTCDVSKQELEGLKKEILPLLDMKKDKFAIYQVCENCYKNGIYIGCDLSRFFTDTYMVL